MRIYSFILISVLLFCIVGCSGKQVNTLEEMVSSQTTQLVAIQSENDSLRSRLIEAEESADVLRELNSAKDQSIIDQEQVVDELRIQNMELKVRLEPTSEEATHEVESTPPPVSIIPAGDEFTSNYNSARDLFNQHQYSKAVSAFRPLVQKDPSHSLADNAQFWLGECQYALKEYENAIFEFEKVFAFANSNKADAAQLKIGLCWIQLEKFPEAREQLVRLMSNYPSSEFVPRARALLDKIP